MSKNIVIQEKGVAQTLNTISRVVTSGSRTGSVDWVPQDECQLGETTIKQNGTYKASTKGLYAFSKVKVRASGKAVGKDKNGNWKVVDVDENGRFVGHPLPMRIAVVTLPTKTAYTAGEPIDITGMVVKAYYEDSTEYGVVYNGELAISPTTAQGTTVTVRWARVGDKQQLTTTFNITVE